MSSAPAISSKWTQYTITNRHEKRAELVCDICHGKKIKCDLQERRKNGHSDCSFCTRSGRQCAARVPKRRPRRVGNSSSNTTTTNKAKSNTEQGSDKPGDALPITPRSHDEPSNNEALSMMSTFHSMNSEPSMPGHSAVNSESIDCRQRSSWSSQQPLDLSALSAPSQQDISSNPRSTDGDSQEQPRANMTQKLVAHPGGDVDTGLLHLYAREHIQDAQIQTLKAFPARSAANSELQVSEELLNIYADTYFDDCYAWCPVLDRETLHHDLARSPFLQNALAMTGSSVRPPILPHDGPAEHYDRARRMFYEDEEPDNLTCIRGILLFNWYAPRSTSVVHRHSSWWWTSVVIRHAQQMAIHRGAKAPEIDSEVNRLGRRVWWTAFARERLTALCQSKPAIIDPADCSVPEPSLDDFPPESRSDPKCLVFIYWIRLCAIIGQMTQALSRTTSSNQPPDQFGEHLRGWIASLPAQIRITLATRHVTAFDKDAYQLHIVYLISVIMLNLRHTNNPGALPIALPPAIFAASCLARVFKTILAKGDTRFLMPITSWYCGVSYITLLAASRDPFMREAVQADMEIVYLMCDQLRKMWASANIVYQGFDRLRAMADGDGRMSDGVPSGRQSVAPQGNTSTTTQSANDTLSPSLDLDWIEYFPFATSETSKTVELLLELRQRDVNDPGAMTWDTSLLDVQHWNDGLLNYTDFTFENEFLDSWVS